MKKIFSIFLVLILMVSMLAGCTKQNTSSNNTPPIQAENTSPKENKPEEDGVISKIGLGHITSIGKSKDLGVDKDGKDILPVGQVDTVIAAVGFDKDGKVVKVTIDTAQTKVNFDKDLKVTSDLTAANKTKVELKEEYGMVKASSIGKEWFQQIEELEKWMIGKTVDEIKSMKVKERDESHKSVPDVPELTSTVTITVEGYISAVEEAYNNAIEIGTGAKTLGLGNEISIGKSKGFEVKDGKEILPVAQVDTTMALAAFDKDGKVVGTIIDVAQTKINFDAKGKITTDKNAEIKTKFELGPEYGMIKASSIGKEWFQQIAELEKWMVGKTANEIKSIKVKERDEAHKHVPDVAELTSTVTVTVEGYISAVAESYANAK